MTPEFELSVIPLIKHVPASLEAFKNLLPIGKFVRSPSTKKGTTVFTKQPCLNDKIRVKSLIFTFNDLCVLSSECVIH